MGPFTTSLVGGDNDVDSGFKEKAVFEQVVPRQTGFYMAAVAVTRAFYKGREVF